MNDHDELSESDKRLKARLEEMLWEEADRIGNPSVWFRLGDFTDEQMAGYAYGVKSTVLAISENSPIGGIETLQLDAALGERLRRLNSPGQKLASRMLNNLVEKIRDKRIAMLDRCETIDYANEYRVWQKKVWGIERTGFQTHELEAEFQTVRRELHALWELHSHLWGSKSWVDKRMEMLRNAKLQEAA